MLNTLKRLFKHLKKPKLDSKVYLIFAAASLLLFLILSQTINFTHPPFSFLYPKPKSQASEEYPVSPYISSNYLQPLYGSPDFSYYLQPWRGYLKTVPATDLLSGIGINYNYGLAYQPNPPVNNDAIIKQLAESGFRRVRLEVFWGALNWDETNFWIGSRVQSILAACKKYGVRPLILLNANSVTPTPYKSFSKTLTQPAAIGDFVLHLNSTDGLIVNKSGITTTPGDVVMSHILFKEIDANTNTVTLSQPLSANFSSGQTINGYTMKYSPLFPVGTPEFDETMAGWKKYTQKALDLVTASGISDFDVEIWNELGFGSEILGINNYYNPPLVDSKWDVNPFFNNAGNVAAFQNGGQAWEVAKQTKDFINQSYPGVNVIWGYSNNMWPPPLYSKATVPQGLNGLSLHPYNSQQLTLNGSATATSTIEGYGPNMTIALPEGLTAEGENENVVEKILHPLNSAANFDYYLTEHAALIPPASLNDTDAKNYKARNTMRYLLFWLNKGIKGVYTYDTYEDNNLHEGLLDAAIPLSKYGTVDPSQLMSPELNVLENATRQFSGAEPIAQSDSRQLSVDVTSIGSNQPVVFSGDLTHPPLYQREMYTFLPFQVNPHKFVIGSYVMTYNALQSFDPMTFKVTIHNLNGQNAQVSYYDPVLNQNQPIQVLSRTASDITLEMDNTDYPRLISIDDSQPPQTSFELESDQTSLQTGQTIAVKVIAKSNIPANLFGAELNFPADKLAIESIETDNSFITNWATKDYDNQSGTVSLVGGVAADGIQTDNNGLVMATINFKVLDNLYNQPTALTISFNDQSSIYREDDSLNILNQTSPIDLTILANTTSFIPTPTPSPVASQTPEPTLPPFPNIDSNGDINSDGVTDLGDLSVLLANFAKRTSQVDFPFKADLNNDTIINSFDFSYEVAILKAYGKL